VLSTAWAAVFFTSLSLEVHGVENFNKGGLSSGSLVVVLRVVVSLRNSNDSVSTVAFAATLLFILSFTSRLLALQFTLGSLAVSGLDALVSTIQNFTNRRAVGFRSCASGVALRRCAHGLTVGARSFLALLRGATNTANWSFTMNHTLRA
jgi:hypothetical protein